MKQCEKCETWVEDDMSYCTECGVRIYSEKAESEYTKHNAENAERKSVHRPKISMNFRMNNAARKALTKFAIGIVIGIIAAVSMGGEMGSLSGIFMMSWIGTGIVFCPTLAVKFAKFLGLISSWGGVPAVIVGWILGGVLGLALGPIVGIYHLIIAISSGLDA